ncbi:MAG TPA: AAA family ATPase, partial [Hyphomicrobium sp.]|nr:AAA family ATPase [Hyphomicrobium sp.]
MKLSKVEMTYFRCFESLNVDLRPDINVIVGANGAGKSSILDAIAVGLYEIVAANGGGGKRQRSVQGAALRPNDIYIDADAKDITSGRKSFVQIRASAVDYYPVDGFSDKGATGQAATIEWSQYISYSPPDNFSYDTASSERLSDIHRYFQNIWYEIRASSQSALIPLPAIAYYRAHRRINGSLELGDVFKSDISRTDAFTQALDASAKFSSMCQWLYLRENEELRARVDDREKGVESFRDLSAVRHALGQTIEGLKRIYFDGRPPRLMAD